MVGRRHRRREHYERFVALPHYMLRSEAWRTLPPPAKAMLIEIWARHNGSNNGTIAFSVRDAMVLGIGRSTASRMFDHLIERGFLVMTRESSFAFKLGMSRLWRLTAERSHGTDPTKEFVQWPSVKQPVVRPARPLKK